MARYLGASKPRAGGTARGRSADAASNLAEAQLHWEPVRKQTLGPLSSKDGVLRDGHAFDVSIIDDH